MTLMNDLWIEKLTEGKYRIGLGEKIQDDAGDIEFVNIHKPGHIAKDDVLMNIEASKAAIEIPIEFNAEILEVNEAALENPSSLNDPNKDQNWLAIFKVEDPETVQAYL